jgi:hypothetical protein
MLQFRSMDQKRGYQQNQEKQMSPDPAPHHDLLKQVTSLFTIGTDGPEKLFSISFHLLSSSSQLCTDFFK